MPGLASDTIDAHDAAASPTSLGGIAPGAMRPVRMDYAFPVAADADNNQRQSDRVTFEAVFTLTQVSSTTPDQVVEVDADGDGNWLMNRDASTSTPYQFSTTPGTLGTGSLYIPPIGSTPANARDKFIAEHFLYLPVAQLESIAYDFRIAGNGAPSDANDFYLNVYTVRDGSPTDTFYDCRFDYVPSTGSTSGFTTASFAAGDTPTNVRARTGQTCPATLAGMTNATVTFFSLSVGDTSLSDQGLAGYFDNVVVDTTTGTTTYDFEAP